MPHPSVSSENTVLITGASAGIGQACAEIFAGHQQKLILLARRKEKLLDLQQKLGGPEKIQIIGADVRDEATLNAGIQALPESFSRITVLVNNAGLALGLDLFQTIKPENRRRMIETNIEGLLNVTEAVLPRMVQQNCGHIINIGSIAGNYPYAGGNVYGATKAFVEQFSRNLRCDLLGTPVRVSLIKPGLCETDFSLVRFRGDKAAAGAVYDGKAPLKAEDIAEAVYWCFTQPPHVNVNTIEIMPVSQAAGGLKISNPF